MNLREHDIVVGALVQWTGARTYGVITDRDDRMIYVRWDEAGLPSQFAIGAPPLLRVELQGQEVRLLSTGESAAVLQATASDTPAWRCFVASDGGKTVNVPEVNVPEAGLRPVAITDPIRRFKGEIIGSMQQYRLQEVTRWYRVMHLYLPLLRSRVPGSGVRGRGSGERETTASSLAGKEESSRKEDNGGQGKDGPAGAVAQGGNGR